MCPEKDHPYTIEDAVGRLDEAYSTPAREPWGGGKSKTTLQRPSWPLGSLVLELSGSRSTPQKVIADVDLLHQGETLALFRVTTSESSHRGPAQRIGSRPVTTTVTTSAAGVVSQFDASGR